MESDAPCKLGLFLPAGLHQRMVDANCNKPRGALQDAYAAAFAGLLDALDGGAKVVFAAVRGPKHRVTVRLSRALCARLRARSASLNLKITDFACAAIVRHLPQT
jgi:hypothetical protein